MAETLPTPNDKTVIVPTSHLCKLWTMTVVSLVLNAVIIVLLLVGAIIHHHQMHRGFADRGERHFARMMAMNQGWNVPQGFRGGSMGGGRFEGPGPMDGGPGMGGMMGREKSGPPDPAKMSQDILDHLSQQLSLTGDEQAKVKPILDQQVADIQKQMETLRDSVKKQMDAQHEAMKKQIEDTKVKIRPLLTPEQQKDLAALHLTGQKPEE